MRICYKRIGKRLLDISIAMPSLIVLSPFLLFVGLIVFICHGKPILFKQRRPGLNGEPFTIYKFCTMNNKKDHHGNLLPDSDRLTPIGRFLRSTSIDELPEFINIIKGEMSLVGPRPLLMEYLDRYTKTQARRHEIKPGLTGWAQINGRNTISWEEKFKFDIWYVDNYSFFLDLKILAVTIVKILRRDGISQQGKATCDPFIL